MRVADLSLPLSLAALVAVPFVFGDFIAYQVGLFLLYGIVAQGIALCWGRVGILPLGQALFFGLGAYLGGGALIRFEHSSILLYPALLGAVLAPAVVAGAIGILVFRRNVGSGPYFSLITLALSMLAYQVALGADWLTGGYMGLNGIPPLPGTDPWSTLYWVILGALVLSTGVLLWITRSPLGQLLHAVSQNEDRLSFLGFDIARLKALAFAVSAALAGMAGALYAAQQGIVTPQVLAYVLSGELLIWTAVGGRASLIGPVAGAVLIGMLTSNLRDRFQYWEILLALLFLAIVLSAPTGLAGLIAPLLKRLPKRAHAMRDVERPLPDRGDMPMLSFEEVRVTIGSVRILQGLTLELKKRGLHCLIGPNGAGKTSAFNALMGRLQVSGGRITWGGRDITGLPAHKVARLGIARKLQVPAIFHDMTVGVHLDIALWSGCISARELLSQRSFRYRNEILGVLKEMFSFLNDEEKRAGDLSLGHRQVLEFALSVIARPEVVLLDEPCAGLSTQETADLTAAIRKIAGRFDISALIIEHDFSVVEELSDHIFVLHQGQTLSEGTLEAIRADHKVQAVYTGGAKMRPHLRVSGLTAGYGDLVVLRDLSFDVAEGEILCITGRNGVGKTTLMRAVSGALPLLAGNMTLNGQDITALATNKRQKLGLSYGPQENVSFAPLTVRENLTLHLDRYDLSRYERLFQAFPRIEERLEQKAGSLSGGERKILSFCRVMAEGGSLVALDEPTEGVAPENIALMIDAIRSAAAEGKALAIVEQNLTLVEAVADKVIVIDHGAIIYRCTAMPNLRQEIEAQLRV